MELETGDIAIIDDFEYPIQDIKSEGIYIRNPDKTISLLVYIDNKWRVQNSVKDHKIQFTKREIQLTGIPEIDLNILINLDHETLVNFCKKRLSPLCESDYLWQQKVIYDFGQEIAMNKPIDETYLKQYKKLLDTYQKMEVIKSNNEFDRQIKDLIRYSVRRSRIDLLSLIKPYINPSVFYDYIFGIIRDTKVLRWLLQDPQILDNPRYLHRVVSYAAKLGDIQLLNEFAERNILPDEEAISLITASGRNPIETLEWIWNKGIPITIRHEYMLDNIAYRDRIEILKWLVSKNIFNPTNVADMNFLLEEAKEDNAVKILDWLKSYGYV